MSLRHTTREDAATPTHTPPLYTRSATALRAMMDAGTLTSEALVQALLDRADATEPEVGGFSQLNRERALSEARQRDAERRAGDLRGPLHGLPLTVKDNIDVAGMRTTIGLRSDAQRPAPTRDAAIVAAARAAGAVILGKSNVPQAMLSMHGTNALYGTTHNPWSRAHVAGGSSSGAGALLATGAAALCLGTDLGGSVRFPAAFCGVVGLKPTLDAWSNRGVQAALSGQTLVRAQVGPMARTCADLALMWDALGPEHQHALDPRVPPRQQPAPPALAALRVGVFTDDGLVPVNPAMRRAVEAAADGLRTRGVEVVPFQPPRRRALIGLYMAGVSADGMATLQARFGDEPVAPSQRLLWMLGKLPRRARKAATRALELAGEPHLALAVSQGGARSVAELWRLHARLDTLASEVDDAWRAAGIDAVLCPASACPAVPIGMEHDAAMVFSHYAPYNLLSMPAGVVPTTHVRPDETQIQPPGRGRIARRLAQIAAHSRGLPVAVQVAAPRWRDRTVLALMAAIEAHAAQHSDAPKTPLDPRR